MALVAATLLAACGAPSDAALERTLRDHAWRAHFASPAAQACVGETPESPQQIDIVALQRTPDSDHVSAQLRFTQQASLYSTDTRLSYVVHLDVEAPGFPASLWSGVSGEEVAACCPSDTASPLCTAMIAEPGP